MMWVVSVWCVVMVVCVSPGCRSQAVTPELLQTIMSQIWNTYGNRIRGQYSLAISIPWDRTTRQYQVQTVFNVDQSANVINRVNGGAVYAGTYVVAAGVLERTGRLGSQHSEYRVLAESQRNAQNQMVNSVRSLRGRNLLVFYTLNSPCSTCTDAGHAEGILEKIKVIKDWNQYAVVFTQAFLPRGTVNQTPDQVKNAEASRRDALGRLAGSLTGGLPGTYYIHRCFNNGECFRCLGNQGTVLKRCVTLDGAAAPQVIRPPSPEGGGWVTAGRGGHK